MSPFTVRPFLAAVLGIGLAVGQPVPSAAQAGVSEQDAAAANFRMADVDSDGVLNEAEFIAFIDLNAAQGIGQAERIQRLGAYQTAFARLDGNGDGAVSPDELQEIGS